MTVSNTKQIEFSFGWLALKLLGKSLYSNVWSALSELVANGFDAKAKNVYIYMDITNKAAATIEILDDGKGMDDEGLSTYVKVGSNNRNSNAYEDDFLTMGRKGIGKLAALYLSSNYIIITKTHKIKTQWKMVYDENAENKEDHPYLSQVDEDIPVFSSAVWNSFATGTLIQMKNVDLQGLGDKAYEALRIKLSNIFALDAMGDRSIFLYVKEEESSEIVFEKIKKEIAFKNMAFIDYNFEGITSNLTAEITGNQSTIIKFPLTKLNGSQFYQHLCEVKKFEEIENLSVAGQYEYIKDPTNPGEKISKPYILTGWIGIHASINDKQAKINDERFLKNKFYNPIQLRLYVRNKLAVENFLPILGNTQAFVNYIEGEIHFDLLDDDDLPDIATSSRQGLNESDKRVELLKALVGKIVSNLISARNALAKTITEKEKELGNKQKTTAKKQFAKEVQEELDDIEHISTEDKVNIANLLTSKIQGEVTPKSDYTVFISHSSSDKILTDFIYYLLKYKGAKKEEFFYTSADDSAAQYDDLRSLSTQIKENIVNKNTRILYVIGKDYKSNEYCMFEGGAGWATRSVGEFLLLSTTYEEVPAFLTNGKKEFWLEKNKKIALNRKEYLYIVRLLNKLINHLNAGRIAKNEDQIKLFEEPDIPDDNILKKTRKTVQDYMDKDIIEYWDTYVVSKLEDYLEKRHFSEELSLLGMLVSIFINTMPPLAK